MPGAVLSGHVVDEEGDPMQGCNIQLHPPTHPEQGVPMMGVSPPNQDGAYRVYGIAPGKYIVSAQCWNPSFNPGVFRRDRIRRPRKRIPRNSIP
jgi:hypothetical protein